MGISTSFYGFFILVYGVRSPGPSPSCLGSAGTPLTLARMLPEFSESLAAICGSYLHRNRTYPKRAPSGISSVWNLSARWRGMLPTASTRPSSEPPAYVFSDEKVTGPGLSSGMCENWRHLADGCELVLTSLRIKARRTGIATAMIVIAGSAVPKIFTSTDGAFKLSSQIQSRVRERREMMAHNWCSRCHRGR